MIFFFLTFLILLSSKTMAGILLMSVFAYIYCNKINNVVSKKKMLFVSVIVIIIMSLGSITLTERFLFENKANLNEVLNKKEFGNDYLWTGSSIRLLQLRILKAIRF